ncbi:hypothetical protein AN958_07314, partial [Leucoagaricus sp. SymC.cos]
LYALHCISLTGMRDSARVVLVVLSIHIVTMCTLIISAAVHWGYIGDAQLEENWAAGGISPSQILKQVYYGFCLGMLGFECIYALSFPNTYSILLTCWQFPHVLRNLHLPAIVLNSVKMLLVLAIVLLDVLECFKSQGAKPFLTLLRIWIVIEAVVVLCGGVLTCILVVCELFGQPAADTAIPTVFLRELPVTGAPFAFIITFAAFCGLLYVSAAGRLDVVSQMLLKYNRGRSRRDRRTALLTTFFAFIIICVAVAVAVAGNIVVYPRTFRIVHFFDEEKGAPSELEANTRILDETFPGLIVDLILVPGQFKPKAVAALSHKLDIPTSLTFMTCPGSGFTHSIAELETGIISL